MGLRGEGEGKENDPLAWHGEEVVDWREGRKERKEETGKDILLRDKIVTKKFKMVDMDNKQGV